MRVLIVNFEGNLFPLIVNEEETMSALHEQWKKSCDVSGSFAFRLMDSETLISSSTRIAELPLPQPGYSSIEVMAERVSKLHIRFCEEIPPVTVELSLTATLEQLRELCCAEIDSPPRNIDFCKEGDDTFSDADDSTRSLSYLGFNDDDVLRAKIRVHFCVVSIDGSQEKERLLEIDGDDKLHSLFDPTSPTEKQRLYYEERLVDSNKTPIEMFGFNVGASDGSRIRIRCDRKIAIQVQVRQLSKRNSLVLPNSVVYVWPSKGIGCIQHGQNPDYLIWRDDTSLSTDSTFKDYGIVENDILYIDKKITVQVKGISKKYNVDIRRTASVDDLMKKVAEKEENSNFQLFFQKSLLAPDSEMLRRLGVRHKSVVDVSPLEVEAKLIYEGKTFPSKSFAVGSSFGTLIQKLENILNCNLPANTYLKCECGRRVSQEEDLFRNRLPFHCCDAAPRVLTVHRLLDVKVTDLATKTSEHVKVDSMGTIKDVLISLKLLSGCRLYYNDVVVSSSSPLLNLYSNNRIALKLEKKIAVLICLSSDPLVKWLWPSSSLGSLVESLMNDGLVKKGRIEVKLGEKSEKLLASYGGKAAVCNKTLTDYGIEDGSVLTIGVKDGAPAGFKIVCHQWGINSFNISVPTPVSRNNVFAAIASELAGTKKAGCTPVLAQVQARSADGGLLLCDVSNGWVNRDGELEDPVEHPRFCKLGSIVEYIPNVPTKIHLRSWEK